MKLELPRLLAWILPKPPKEHPMSQPPSQQCLDLIKQFEGCKLQTYKDSVGVATIGWGHTGSDVRPGLTWTQAQADKALEQDALKAQTGILAVVRVALTPGQLAALTSFVFNLGIGNFKSSTLLKYLNNGKFQEAADQFLRWDKAGGKQLKGLVTRRAREREVFLSV